MKFSGVTILQGVEFPIFLLIFAWALQQCSATALPVMDMHPQRHTSISASILCAGGESPRTSSTTVGIDWMCLLAKTADVGGRAQLRLPRAHSVEVEQSVISTA